VTNLIWSFSPWLVFLLASRFVSFSGAVALGFVAAMIVLVRAMSQRHAHLLDLAGLCYFVALAVVLAITHPAHIETWSRYAQLGSHLVLTVLILGSILIRRPFTESYARESTPKELWHTREFREVNRRISAVWGLAFVIGDVSLAFAGSVDARQVLLRIIVPFGSLFIAYRYTETERTKRQSALSEPN
jgi:hypothetical protein